jgi:hypothetical protein
VRNPKFTKLSALTFKLLSPAKFTSYKDRLRSSWRMKDPF